jgi:hypothetical protein
VPVDTDEPHRAAGGGEPADAGGESVNGWFPGVDRADGSTLGVLSRDVGDTRAGCLKR